MTVLFPPVLESQALAFPYFSQDDIEHFFEIRFPMPTMTSIQDIKHVQVSLKYANTGEPAVNTNYAPDGQTLFIAKDTVYFPKDSSNGNYVIRIPYWCFGNGAPAANTTYLVQVRFGSNTLWPSAKTGLEGKNYCQAFASWRQLSTTNVPSYFGEWSNIQKAYCYKSAGIELDYNFSDFVPEIVWTYAPTGDDPISQIKLNYSYKGFNGEVIKTEVFNGQYNDDNVFTLNHKLKVAPVVPIMITVEAVTTNNTVYVNSLEIPSVLKDYNLLPVMEKVKQGDIWYPIVKDTDLRQEETEDAILAKTIILPENSGIKSTFLFNVYRINTLTLSCVKIISQQDIFVGEELTFRDWTCEMGEDYLYLVCAFENGKMVMAVNDLYPFGDKNPAYARLMKMEFSYLTTKNHQLRIAGDVKLNSFKRNTQDVFQTTLGGQYPFYSRPSKINYRTFSLSALISVNFDPTATFMRIDTWGTIRIGDQIKYDRYKMLISSSPGLSQFFTKIPVGIDEEPLYRFVGPKQFPANYTEEQKQEARIKCQDFVNRCSATLILNGMWWDDDDGNSYLAVQDRDLIESQELSLSRRRTWGNNRKNGGEELVELGKEKDFYQKYEKMGSGPASFYGEYLHRSTGLVYGTDLNDSLIFVERKFRDHVMKWLSNGKPKLFRSETEGNMIVILSNVSFTPYDRSGRMVYSMTATATEIAEFNDDNLFEYDLIPTTISSVYLKNSEFDYIWGQDDVNVSLNLKYVYNEIYDIPDMLIGDAAGSLSIDTYPAVIGGTPPYTFSAENLPDGISICPSTDPTKGELAGMIIGYPRADIKTTIPPGYSTLKVTDSADEPATAIMEIRHGYMYTELSVESPITIGDVTDIFVVGQPITPQQAVVSGGVPPYNFLGVNLPPGISVDRVTGEVRGAFSQEIWYETDEDGNIINTRPTAYIIVTDRMGQRKEILVTYGQSRFPLTFNKMPGWDYDYTEVKIPIPRIKLYEGVYGGIPPYTFSFVPGHEPPEGWLISDGSMTDNEGKVVEKNVLFGVPVVPMNSGSFIVQVEDSVKTTRQITIYFNQVLDEFKFIYDKNFDVIRDEKGELSDISMGTDISSVVLLSGVSGGLKFPKEPYYRFEATGLLPNFKISNYGEITGKAQVALAKHQAIIFAIDARGERRVVTGNTDWPDAQGITIATVTSALRVLRSKYKVSGLIKGVNIEYDNVMGYDLDGQEVPGNKIYPNIVLKDGNPIEDLMVVEQNFPDGITIEPIYKSEGGIDHWEIVGAPSETTNQNLEGWINFSNSIGESVLVPISFEPILGELVWNDFSNIIASSPNLPVSLPLLGLSGGSPTYSIRFGPSVPEWVTTNFTINGDGKSLSGWYLKGTVPDMEIETTMIELIARDGNEKEVKGYVKFLAMNSRLRLKVKTSMRNITLYRGLSNVPLTQIVEASGGDGNYIYSFENPSADFPGGFTLNPDNASIQGVPTKLHTPNTDLGPYFKVTDGTGKTAGLQDQSWTPFSVVDPPVISPSIGGKPEDTDIRYELEKAYVNTQFDTPILFELVSAGIEVSYAGIPQGLSVYQKEGRIYISGSPGIYSEDPIDMTITVKIPENQPYNGEVIKRVVVTIPSITGRGSFDIPSTVYIPATGVGKAITPIDLSPYLKGGTGKFEWIWDNPPPGLTLTYDQDTGRTATISGTAGALSEARRIAIRIIDRGTTPPNYQVYESSIYFYGFFEPLVISGSATIPSYNGLQTITPVSIKELVSGGVPDYNFYDPDNILEKYGYILDTNSGEITGQAVKYGVSASTGKLQVIDKEGQTADIQISIGEIKGELYASLDNITGPKVIVKGKKGTSLATQELLNLNGSASGGTPPYSYHEDVSEEGWAQKGWTCTMDATGKFTAIKRPDNPCAAGSFLIEVHDAAGTRFLLAIPFEEVTE